MSLTLDNFKRSIDSTILARGRDYYVRNRVTDLSLDDESSWSAVVEGSEAYDVRVTQAPDSELDCTCTCPYEYGPQCKHVAAVLYAIEETFPEYLDGRRRKPAKPRRTRFDRLREALQQAPPEQLIALLIDLAEADRDTLNRLLLQLGATGEKPADYRRLVKDALRPPRGSGRFLDYRDAMAAARKVDEILDQAGASCETRPQQALAMYQAVLELTVDALRGADDSSGMLGANIEVALDGITRCSKRLPLVDQADLFRYALQQAASERFADWDWRWNLFRIAVDLAEDDERRAALDAALDSCLVAGNERGVDDWSRRYLEERVAEIRLVMVLTYGGEAAALEFMRANRRFNGFRRRLINYYLERDDLSAARELAREGVTASERDRTPGNVTHYRELLLEIARRTGDTSAIVGEARELWFVRSHQTYLNLLRQHVSREDWPAFRARLLSDRRCRPDMAAQVLAGDELWPELLNLGLRHPYVAESYRHELEPRYPDEISALYSRIVEKKLEHTTNRVIYEEAAEYLRRMKQMGHAAQADELARTYIARFPQRRAMIEELRRA